MSKFSVLSYNTHLFQDSIAASMSGFLNIMKKDKIKLLDQDQLRRNDIADRCDLGPGGAHSYDLIGLTEVWSHKYQDYFTALMKKDHYAAYAYQGESALSGSAGMVLGAKGAFRLGPSFSKYKGMVDADKFSSKGVAYGVAKLGPQQDMYIGITQTHAQASYTGSESSDEKARESQLSATLYPALAKVDAWMGTFFAIKKKGTLLFGDMNIVGGSSEYETFSKSMAEHGYHDAWVAVNGKANGYSYVPSSDSLVDFFDSTQKEAQRLDYIFYKGIGDSKMTCTSMKVLTDWKTQSGLDLSDHYPVTAEFQFAD